MIGDTTYDLEMARNAGTAAVGVCSGSHCREELQSLEPLACLERVVEVRGWLAERTGAGSRPLLSSLLRLPLRDRLLEVRDLLGLRRLLRRTWRRREPSRRPRRRP